MLEVGKFNDLTVLESSERGVYLDDGEGGEVRLLLKEAPEGCKAGDTLSVFVYYNTDDKLIATTQKPYATVDEFASLKVTSLQDVGAFLDWGLPKELFLPFREQTRPLRIGDRVSVFIYLDKSFRISSSMRVEKYIDREPYQYHEGEEVDLFLASRTDLGFKAVINNRHLGVLYGNEIFQPVEVGQKVRGYIKKHRPDGKIDLTLHQTGYRAAKSIEQKILSLLEENGGFLNVTDKSSAETIYELFEVSKKKFKMAVGGLYKKHLISLEDDGIRLTPPR